MNRITKCFEQARQAHRQALVGYLTAGDPNMTQSERDMRTALRNGIDILEVGMPFSDPTADGPVIQAAAQRALAAGANLALVLNMVKKIRRDIPAPPIILFSYANPMLRYGYKKLCRDAAAAGIDGILAVDIPFEESEELRCWMRPQGLALIQLVAPTTSKTRIRTMLADADGFVYYILVKGVTGGKSTLTSATLKHLRCLKQNTPLPIVAGFGINTAEQARQLARHVEGVVVGSVLVQAARKNQLAATTRKLANALRT